MQLFSPNGASTLTIIGAMLTVFGLLHALVMSRRSGAGIIGVLLALLAGSAFCGGAFGAAFSGMVWPLVGTFIGGLVNFGVGLALLVGERRAKHYGQGRSFGLLYTGIGLWAVVSAIVLPALPGQMAAQTAFVAQTTATPTPARTSAPTRTPLHSPTPTLSPTWTVTPTPLPTLTYTPAEGTLSVSPTVTSSAVSTESITPATATGSPTPALRVVCKGIVTNNVNLRTGPAQRFRRLLTIPYNTTLDITGQSADGGWWQVVYQDQRGWVLGQYLILDRDCKNAPIAAEPLESP